jgi:hypothetical protein
MVALSDSVLVWCASLSPPVVPNFPADVNLQVSEGVPTIVFWREEKLGKQPDAKALAAVTDQQVKDHYARKAQAEALAILGGSDGTAALHRAVVAATGLTTAQVQAQLPAASVAPDLPIPPSPGG